MLAASAELLKVRHFNYADKKDAQTGPTEIGAPFRTMRLAQYNRRDTFYCELAPKHGNWDPKLVLERENRAEY